MDIPQYVRRAYNALEQGEFQLARQYFDQVLNANPDNEAAKQGLYELEIAKAKKNWSIITRGVKIGYCWLLLQMGQAKKAQKDMEILNRIRPKNRFVLTQYAQCQEKLGELDKAHEAYDRALKLKPDDTKLLEADANLLIRLDRLDEAAERLERLQRLRPDDDKITHRLRDISANSYARSSGIENLKERRALMEKELRDKGMTSEFSEKLAALNQAFEANPEDLDIGVSIAQHLRQGKFHDEANRILGPLLDKNSQHFGARLEQARLWRLSGDFQIAVNLFQELSVEKPDDLALLDELYESKIALLENQQLAAPNKDRSHELEHLKVKRNKNKIVWLEHILNHQPDKDAERAELGALLIQYNQIDRAIEILQRLIQQHAWAGKGLLLLGQCFMAKQDYKLAIVQFEKALAFFKDKGYSHIPSEDLKSIWYNLGLSYEYLGNREAARDNYGHIYAVDIHYKDIRQRYEETNKLKLD